MNAKSTETKPSIVFAHGIWADGSCFQKLIPTLRTEGYEVMAAQYGLDTLKGILDIQKGRTPGGLGRLKADFRAWAPENRCLDVQKDTRQTATLGLAGGSVSLPIIPGYRR